MAVSGMMEADAQGTVAQRLMATGYVPVEIAPASARPHWEAIRLRFRRVPVDQLIFFNRQLATLVKVGIPLLDGFTTLARQTKSKAFERTLLAVARDIETGLSLSEALSRHPTIFSEVYVSTIRAGETGGFLDVALERLASLTEHDAETRAKIRAATRYPILVVIAICAAFAIIMTFVVPKFALLYSSFRTTLPLPTRIAIGLSFFFQRWWWALAAGLSAIGLAIRLALETSGGRLWWDRTKLRLPILGDLILKLTLSRLTHILSLLVKSGVPILKSLEVVGRAIGNAALAESLQRVYEEVERGRPLTGPMARDPLFPPVVVQMVAVGEKTGELEGLLQKISEHYDMEAQYTIRNLSTALEPILLAFIGTLVFFLALAVFLPMWDMVRLVRH